MTAQIRKYPIGTQDFKILREGGFVYVDKTKFIEKLLNSHRQVFLSRPRRFGKSLFLSTLKYYFLGRKNLFEGLYISEVEKTWAEYPVFHIEFNLSEFLSINDLHSVLNKNLTKLEALWGRDESEGNFGTR
ncbi:MAG: AAA family ATPase, partial [Bacteroidales bacterium]|nr:AAA family ATPase [Bacteroidales bacterium]